ncbi:ABC transporter ATP-binding protein [[Clostridium] hylemonae]|uniref:ABC transporter, ATP-binding protein n=1 Tax=[Clostridium] hylemonae DSM 15053 TaxID=553973 RepID=C0C502_9FIRM|nr:ABC transporter ATP-binding protein [[Clostridium] hylemonae]EEG72770.1 ABC transporter, ATP-binding protein [[Clostridium] hylemonae DSM 15053]QEK16120.1 putative ABC transporter ATP-binding protein [[Clostridium] hylemonae DSM 15053]
MRRLLKYLKEHPLATVLAPLFKMLEASFELFVPLVVARMIDTGIRQQMTGYLWQMGGVLVLLGVVGFGFSVTAQYFAAKSAVSAGMAMRNDLFAHINTLSYKEIDAVGASTLINRMTNDVNQVQNGINMFLRLFLRSPFVVFGAMIMAFTVDVKAALPFAVAIPLLLLVVFAILLVSMPLYRKVQKQVDKVLLSTRENLLGIRVVRAFNHQDSEMKHFREQSTALFHRQIHVGKISALLNPLTYVIINLGVIAILWTGGRQVSLGTLTQGQVIALINYMSQILAELIKLANLIILLSKSMASLNRVNQVFDMQPSIDSTGLPLSQKKNAFSGNTVELKSVIPAVQFDNVSFCYTDSGKETLSGVSFSAMPGQTIGVIGGTGSGKTSLISLIPRFYDVSKGAVLVNGQDVRTLNPVSLRSRVGLVPQRAQLFKGTLRENIRWGKPDASDEDIYQALDTAQAREFVDAREKGLELMIEQEGGNLSGGQKQRLTIARALVRRPEILILDDSASALDFATDARLRQAIRETTGQMTVFIVSQRVSAIRNADMIIVLDDGEMAGYGTHGELLRSSPVYKEICESQTSGQEETQYANA